MDEEDRCSFYHFRILKAKVICRLQKTIRSWNVVVEVLFKQSSAGKNSVMSQNQYYYLIEP